MVALVPSEIDVSCIMNIVHHAEAVQPALEAPLVGQRLNTAIRFEEDCFEIAGCAIGIACLHAELVVRVDRQADKGDRRGCCRGQVRPSVLYSFLILVGIVREGCVRCRPCYLCGKLVNKVCGCQIGGCGFVGIRVNAEIVNEDTKFIIG